MKSLRLGVAALLSVGLSLALAPLATASVSCGQTVTADTTLDRDLVDCPGEGVVIGADGIRLDLNGHTIDGDGRDVGSPDDDGVDNTGGFDDVVIANGRIQGFEAGVRLGEFAGVEGRGQAERNEVLDLRLVDNDTGVLVIDSHRNRVWRNRVDNVDGGSGISLANRASGNLIAENVLTRAGFGIDVVGDSNRLVDNSAFANAIGISLSFATGNKVVSNDLHDNNGFGIQLAGADENRLVGNRLVRNFDAGIQLFGSRRNLVAHNRAGLSRGAESSDGIRLDHGSLDNRLTRNAARRNRDDGIEVLGAGTLLTGNGARRNGDLGIEAGAGVLDGGGNRAARNGNPAQCTGVRCLCRGVPAAKRQRHSVCEGL